MEKKIEDFYNEIHAEILSLVKFHLRAIEDAKKNGHTDPDEQQKIDLLNMQKDMVQKNAALHFNNWKSDEREREGDAQSRLRAECEKCGKVTPVTVTGEEKSKLMNLTFDIVKCSVCKSEFLNHLPNNWDDRLEFCQYSVDYYSALLKKDKKMPAKVKKDMKRLVAYYDNLAAAQTKFLQSKQKSQDAAKLADQSIEEIRDFLLIAKIKILNWNNSRIVN
jgi:hypothetical protein